MGAQLPTSSLLMPVGILFVRGSRGGLLDPSGPVAVSATSISRSWSSCCLSNIYLSFLEKWRHLQGYHRYAWPRQTSARCRLGNIYLKKFATGRHEELTASPRVSGLAMFDHCLQSMHRLKPSTLPCLFPARCSSENWNSDRGSSHRAAWWEGSLLRHSYWREALPARNHN